MAFESELKSQLEKLQRDFDVLRADYLSLQTEKQKHEDSARSWSEQHTRELDAGAIVRRKAETLQRVFYRIAERAAASLSFYELLQSVHALLGELLYAKNCYVCLYDSQKQVLDFAYYVDERDGDTMQCSDVPFRRGLTEYVLRTERAQLIDATRFNELQRAGEITEATGDLSFTTWLGVPMNIRGITGGALVVQSYEEGIQYNASDADILSFVANHVSSAIERYQALDALRKSEERYRTVIDNVGVGVVVVQDGSMVFANPSMERIVGHPLEYLLSHPFTATVYPDDVPAMVERHQRRLRGEPVESFYGFRVVTREGELRPLELSAVKIEWNKRDATLLFVVDASVRIQAEQTQRIALQKQIELNDMKGRFISMASHEFRTPLTSILSSQNLLKHYGERLSVTDRSDLLDTIESGVHRMTHMLDRVLLLSRADAHMLEFNPQKIDLRALCESVIDESRAQQSGSRCNVHLDFGADTDVGLYDEKLLRHILNNLLSNAIKYSPGGGQVSMKVSSHGGRTVFEVADEGIGIPADEIAHLFESFHRARNVGTIAGTGLGLAIVRQSVDLHAGEITVRSEAGHGTVFTVTL